MRRTSALLLAGMILVACSVDPPADVAFGGDSEPPPTTSSGEAVAWRHLATTEGMLDGSAAAQAVESPSELEAAWTGYGLPDRVPQVDFDRTFVLLLGQADDACVDELIGLEVVDGSLHVEWLPPPGGCNEPLIFRIHAVEVDRRHVPSRFEVAFPEPYAADAHPVTIEVATVDGSPPAAPEPPGAMTDAELDAVFQGHPVRRCTSADDRLGDSEVDGPLSDDPAVAEAQRRRAEFGVPSDEESTREAMSSPQRSQELDFPVLESEMRQDMRASELLDEVQAWLRRQGYTADVDYVPFISRDDGIRPGIWVDGGAAARVRAGVDKAFGRSAVVVEHNPYDFEAVVQAQDDLTALMGGQGPGSIVSITGLPGPVGIGMIDPTRQALDRIAATVDPALVCVGPDLSGVTVGQP